MAQHEKRIAHMVKRRAAGLTFKELGEEYDLSPQHVSRLVRSTYSPTKNVIKDPSPSEYDEV